MAPTPLTRRRPRSVPAEAYEGQPAEFACGEPDDPMFGADECLG